MCWGGCCVKGRGAGRGEPIAIAPRIGARAKRDEKIRPPLVVTTPLWGGLISPCASSQGERIDQIHRCDLHARAESARGGREGGSLPLPLLAKARIAMESGAEARRLSSVYSSQNRVEWVRWCCAASAQSPRRSVRRTPRSAMIAEASRCASSTTDIVVVAIAARLDSASVGDVVVVGAVVVAIVVAMPGKRPRRCMNV